MNQNYNEYSFELSIEEELINKISSGDIESLHKLYELTSKGIYAFVLSILKNPDEAEELLELSKVYAIKRFDRLKKMSEE